MIKFGQLLPDQPDLNNAGVTVATNVVPAVSGYNSLRGINAYSNAADAKITGMFSAKDDDGTIDVYCGDSTKLYELNSSTNALSNISKSGNYNSTTQRWRFCQFGEDVIAVNFNNETQYKTAAASLFADLSADAPRAKFVAVVRDFVMTGYTYDSTDGNKPYRVRWSGLGDHTSWAISATTQADYQDIADMGAVTGLVGGEYATILLEKGIVRASYIGSPLIFQFDKVETNRGCAYSGSVCNVGHTVFYLADDGFYMFDGNGSKPIGAERINEFFFEDFNKQFASEMHSAVDPLRQIVVWSYPSKAATNGLCDKILIYNYAVDKWSVAEVGVDCIAPIFSPSYSLEDLDTAFGTDLDALPASLDSSLYRGGEFFFAGTRDNKIQTFTGSVLPATIETGEFELKAGKVSLVRNIMPYVNSHGAVPATITAQVASRLRQNDQSSFGSVSSLNTDNYIPVRANGRYHKIRFNISGDWTQAQGFDIEATVIGKR